MSVSLCFAELTRRFPEETGRLLAAQPLLALARDGDLPALRAAFDAEVRVEQEKDRQNSELSQPPRLRRLAERVQLPQWKSGLDRAAVRMGSERGV